ncbi:MAG: hypothetical protein JW814_10210 [Candidatus Krumholzibacteriota bacterium]|nr:hypothetical protein [Candidatus Krumholzibacteriota bacterium]
MRISFQMLSQGPLRNIANSIERYSMLNIKAGSMKNFQKPSDDPSGVRKAMTFDSLIKQNDIYTSNATDAEMFIDVTDSTLMSVKNLIDSAKSIALEMRSSTADSGENVRASGAIEVAGIISDIKDLLNTKFHNKYIFSGHMVNVEPFIDVNGTIQYRGDDNSMKLRVGPTRLIDVTIPGSDFLVLGEEQRLSSAAMNTILASTDLLDDLNSGTGIEKGIFRITTGAGVSADIDLTESETVQDMIDQINGCGLGIICGINPDNGLTLFDTNHTGEMVIENIGNYTTASDLGIAGTSSGGLMLSAPLDPALTGDTLVENVDLLTDILMTGITVTINGVSRDVDFTSPSYPVTVDELLDRIRLSVPGLEVRINESGNGIVMISDYEILVEETGTGSTAADLGILGTSSLNEPYSLFGSLENLRNALIDDDPDALDSIIGQLQAVTDHVLQVEATVGARGKQVESIKNQLMDTRINLLANLSLVEDIDLTQVLTDLAEAQIAYEAALQTASSIYSLSLLDYYR